MNIFPSKFLCMCVLGYDSGPQKFGNHCISFTLTAVQSSRQDPEVKQLAYAYRSVQRHQSNSFDYQCNCYSTARNDSGQEFEAKQKEAITSC